jgi:hypothetical protein
VYKGKLLTSQTFGCLFAVILLVTALSILINIVIPYGTRDGHESDLNYVVSVKTDNYKLNQSPDYPIGALKTGKNLFYLVNTTNENVKGYFVLKIKVMSCDQYLVVNSDNSEVVDRRNLVSKNEYEIERAYEIDSHGGEFISFSVLKNDDSCRVDSSLQTFPISIIDWKMVNKN